MARKTLFSLPPVPREARSLLVAVAWLATSIAPVSAAVPWHVDLAQAKAASQISRRPVLILFVAPWSEKSMRYDTTFLASEESVALLTACFEPVMIDTDVDRGTPLRMDVSHLPCVCVVDTEERVLARFDPPESSVAFVAAAGRAAQDAAVACAGPLPPPPAAATVSPTPPAAADTSAPSVTPPEAMAPAPSPPPSAWPAETAAAPLPAGSDPQPSAAPPATTLLEPQAATPGTVAAAAPPAAAPAPAGTTWLETPPPSAAPAPAASVPPPQTPPAKKPSGFWAAVQKPFGSLVGKAPKPADEPASPAEIPSTGIPGSESGESMPVGFEGYCPVTLVEKGKWSEGRAKWGVRHRGRTYLCAGPDEQRAFLANPDRFAPGLSGDDPVLAFDSGRRVPGQRQYGVTYRAKVYLFSSPDTQAAFKVDPQKYAQRVQVAEQATGGPTIR